MKAVNQSQTFEIISEDDNSCHGSTSNILRSYKTRKFTIINELIQKDITNNTSIGNYFK